MGEEKKWKQSSPPKKLVHEKKKVKWSTFETSQTKPVTLFYMFMVSLLVLKWHVETKSYNTALEMSCFRSLEDDGVPLVTLGFWGLAPVSTEAQASRKTNSWDD